MPGTRVRPPAGPSVNLVPGIHVLKRSEAEDVDGRDEPGHDVISIQALAHRPAELPAILPNTEPAISPVPPG